jgi:hypothetical protein
MADVTLKRQLIVDHPTTVLDYLKGFVADEANNCGYFVYGGSRKLQEKLKHIEPEQYPVMQYERPNIHTEAGGQNIEEWYWCSINVYSKFKTDGDPDENDASEFAAEKSALKVLHDFQKKLREDARISLLEYEPDGTTKDPIMDNYIVNHVGWRMNFKIGLNANFCFY